MNLDFRRDNQGGKALKSPATSGGRGLIASPSRSMRARAISPRRGQGAHHGDDHPEDAQLLTGARAEGAEVRVIGAQPITAAVLAQLPQQGLTLDFGPDQVAGPGGGQAEVDGQEVARADAAVGEGLGGHGDETTGGRVRDRLLS